MMSFCLFPWLSIVTCFLLLPSILLSTLRSYTTLKERVFYFLSDDSKLKQGIIFNLDSSIRFNQKKTSDFQYINYAFSSVNQNVVLNIELRIFDEPISSRKDATYRTFGYIGPLYLEKGQDPNSKFLYMPKRLAENRGGNHFLVVEKPKKSGKKHSGFIFFKKKTMLIVDVYSRSDQLRSNIYNSMLGSIDFVEFSDKSYRSYLNGVRSMARSKLTKAKKYFQRAYDEDDNNYLALYELGNSQAINEEYKKAIESYEDTLEIRSYYQDARLNLINLYLRFKEYDDALDELLLLKKDKNYKHWSCYFDGYMSYFQQKKISKAFSILNKCKKEYPKMQELLKLFKFVESKTSAGNKNKSKPKRKKR